MKIDRLLGITIYLMNHKRVSAQVLAQHFEVSTRTIMRDMNTLCLAGIPVYSNYGVDGGYELLDTFKLERQVMGNVDYNYIVAALQGLATAYDSEMLNETLQKMEQLSLEENKQSMILDFGVVQENKATNEKLTLLEKAIHSQHRVTFGYVNADNISSEAEVEPVVTLYKWYNWYLICYSLKREDYCIYKLVRMVHLKISDQPNSKVHNIQEIQRTWETKEDTRKRIKVKFYGKASILSRCQEYLNGEVLERMENGDFLYQLIVPENELFWFGVILSFGEAAKIIEPDSLIKRIQETCKNVLEQYE